MEIKPTYVTFEQAKLLKEKGFDIECLYYYDAIGDICTVTPVGSANIFKKELYKRPEQWQVIDWLRVIHNVWITITLNQFGKGYLYGVLNIHQCKAIKDLSGDFNTPQAAYSAAFDHILKELI